MNCTGLFDVHVSFVPEQDFLLVFCDLSWNNTDPLLVVSLGAVARAHNLSLTRWADLLDTINKGTNMFFLYIYIYIF